MYNVLIFYVAKGSNSLSGRVKGHGMHISVLHNRFVILSDPDLLWSPAAVPVFRKSGSTRLRQYVAGSHCICKRCWKLLPYGRKRGTHLKTRCSLDFWVLLVRLKTLFSEWLCQIVFGTRIISAYSFCSLSYDRFIAFSEASSPYGTIWCFLFLLSVSSHFLKVFQ
jgi:hypothetical protein